MIVCHCEGLTDRELRRLASSPRPPGQPAPALRGCRAGKVCGGCRTTVEEIVAQVCEEECRMTETQAAPLERAG